MTLGSWLPEPPDLGRFRFRGGGGFPGGMAHLPGDRPRVAVFVPGPLPDGWVPGPPPPMSVEAWSEWARKADTV